MTQKIIQNQIFYPGHKQSWQHAVAHLIDRMLITSLDGLSVSIIAKSDLDELVITALMK